MLGGRPVLHRVSSYDQYGTEMSKNDPEPADYFDCVNKPLYDCPGQVYMAGARCSKCVVRTTERSVFASISSFLWETLEIANPVEGTEPWHGW